MKYELARSFLILRESAELSYSRVQHGTIIRHVVGNFLMEQTDNLTILDFAKPVFNKIRKEQV